MVKKKQILATLVMLSLMQGSVYAAQTITDSNFVVDGDNKVYTVKENPVGSVEITLSKGNYTLNPVQKDSPIVITPTRGDGAAIFINSNNATTDLSSLTINSGVQIQGTEESPLKTTDTVIKVGDNKGGKLTVQDDLLIDNVLSEKSSSASIISVTQGAVDTKTGNRIASSFSGKNITISNSQAVSSPITSSSSALIRITGYKNSRYGDANASFTADNVNLINSSAYRAIYMDTADINLGNISFERGLYNYGLYTYSQTSNVNFTADSIKAVGTGIKTAFIRMYNDESFNVTGDISYDGTGVDLSEDDLTVAGDNHFINFTNTDSVKVGENVTVKNLSWNDNILYVSKAKTAAFGNITIDNITQNKSSDSNGVRVNDVTGKFTAGAIKVTNMKFLQGNNSQYGVFFWDNESADVKSIEVDGVTFYGLEKPNSTADGNGGVSISSTDFDNTLESVVIKNIVQENNSNNKQKYYGLKLSNSLLAAEKINIDTVQNKASNGTAIGLYNSGDMKYKEITISNITGGEASSSADFNAGLYLTSGKKLTDLDTEGQFTLIDIYNINGIGKTYGVYSLAGSTGDLSGDMLQIQNVTSTEAESYGAYLSGKANFDSIYVADIKGNNKAYGILNKGRDNTNFSVSDVTVSGISGNDTAVALAIESGKADFANVNIFNVGSSDGGRIALVSAKDSAEVSLGSGLITNEDFEGSYTPSYTGNFNGTADSETNNINSIALRSVDGAKIILGSNTNAFAADSNTANDGVFTIVGDIVAGRGRASTYAKAGNITLNGKAGTGIYGDIYAGNGGTITVNLQGGRIEGQIDDYHELADYKADDIFRNSAFYDDDGKILDVTSAGKVSLSLDESTWIARGQSFVDTVAIDGGTIDMSKNENSSVTVNNLSGEGKFVMRLNSGERNKSDMLYVTGNITGNYEVEIAGNEFDISEITEKNPLRFATIKGDVNTQNIKARSTDAGFFNNEYTITQEAFSDEHKENEKYNGSDDGQGVYKPGNEFVETTFDANDTNLLISGVAEQSVSDAGKTIINMSRANYKNAIYMDRLNKRLGEARYINGEEDQGMWVRLRHDRIGMDGEFRSMNTMYELGYDEKQDCDNGQRRVGFAIDYMDGSTTYSDIMGKGETNRYGLWLYDTWLGDKGHYADYVVKWGHLDNEFDITAKSTLENITGDYSNNVFSVSAEYGRKKDIGNNWYFEPQAQLQLARVTGADYTTTQNTEVSVDGINSLIGRAGFRLGRDVNKDTTVYVKADLLHEFLGDQTITAADVTGTMRETYENEGTWYDVGFGFATKMSNNSYAYMDFEKSFGNDNDETYQINAGVQWTF